MQLFNKRATKIIDGYTLIQKAENALQSKWRKPLLSVYAQKRGIYDQNLADYNQQRSEFRRRLRWGIWMATILLVLGILVLPGLILINEIGDFRGPLFCFSPLLILSGLTGWAIIVVLWIWQRDQKKPSPPENPLKTDLFYPLLPVWKEGLIGSLPKKKSEPQETGEYRFIARLQPIQADTFILNRMQLAPGRDIDLILIGSKGIWVFEIIHLKGLIRWRDGNWEHIQTNRRLTAKKIQQVTRIEPGFDVAWQLARDDVEGTIRDFTQISKEINQSNISVRGGLVFTHPQGRYDIPPGCPFNWGIVPFWLEKYNSLTDSRGMGDHTIFSIIDALLRRHQDQTQGDQLISMKQHAENIVLNAELNIQNWLEVNKIAEDNGS